ncbi:MAG TPA: RsmG family class I SAM-dependent methyltransferase [Kofleriaceae bacterium]|nr:RsmG family class I SAM-dependent methyltransferase [Kofleriaceae bacterium]
MTSKLHAAFLDLFEKWNKSINLSAASTRAELQEHLADSLHVIPHLRAHLLDRNDARQNASQLTPVVNPETAALGAETETPRVLDVGSGGGFPVVIAAIEMPEVHFTALEPVHKKHAFLRTAARELKLSNLEALARRLDDHDVADYDVAMSRATFDLAEWLAIGSKRVRPGGLVLGFEAVPRTDLPPATVRHPYALAGKQRAIVALSVGGS